MTLLNAAGHPITAPSLAAVSSGGAVRDEYRTTCPVDDITLANWKKRLRMVSPHHDNLSYLELVWEPGWPWEPVGRFMLFECLPLQVPDPGHRGQMLTVVDPEIIKDLQGVDPATLNTHDAITGELTQKTLVTAMQWRLYRVTGRYCRPWWVIQGEGGGHKVFLSDVEKKLLQMAGYPDSFPSPGELPYAPFDNRVLDQVVKHDKLQRANGDVKRMARMSATGNNLRAKALRRQVVEWLGSQMEEAAKTLIRQREPIDAAPLRMVSETKMDEQTAQYVETGKMTDVR